MISQKPNNNFYLNLDAKCLWYLTLTYAMLSLLSSWFVICSISFQHITVNAGILICPITFLLSNFIAEVYGYKNARRAVWCGFFFNMLSIFYALFIINLPSPSYAVHNLTFNSILTTYLKSSFIFMLSYYVAEPFNIFFLAKLKLRLNGYYIKFRLAISVLFSMVISGTIFNLINYNEAFIDLKFISTAFISVLTLLISLPFIIFLIEKVKKIETIDIYDQNTQFNFFKFEVNYIPGNNGFNNLSL
ncbi:VUT family protein [Rickettsiella endosymbiont of Miltochrista miniata]|uniref:VUT family protein n=1 Tax=Rickettsiella endosymbiont of Miltochrista miniata TaxID=3066239 RepID=UPI00313DE7A9